MNIVGKNVTHIKYGKGKITEIQENRIEVEFRDALRLFQFPGAFESFLSISDKKIQEWISLELEKINRQKEMKEARMNRLGTVRGKSNSQGVFGMQENNLAEVFETWEVSCGNYLTGKNQGKPRVPKNIDINSACILTQKEKGQKENERSIAGIFMVEKYKTGKIIAHEHYRLKIHVDEELPLFWSYFSEESRPTRWGSVEMKYVSESVVRKVLLDLVKVATEKERQEEIKKFYDYFCELNPA